MKPSIQSGRRNARVKSLQALYQWDMNVTAGNDPQITAIQDQFLESQDMGRVDIEYFKELFGNTIRSAVELDEHLKVGLDRPVEQLDPIERCVCRLATYEMTERHDIPLKVVINEWVEVTKKFGADQGHKFVNGVMDKVSRSIRSVESSVVKKGT